MYIDKTDSFKLLLTLQTDAYRLEASFMLGPANAHVLKAADINVAKHIYMYMYSFLA